MMRTTRICGVAQFLIGSASAPRQFRQPDLRMRQSGPPVDRCVEASGVSNRKIESWLPEWAEEFDFWAAVHDDFEAGVFGQYGGLVVIDADLTP